MFWLLIKVALLLLLLLVGLACYKHYSALNRAKFYEAQGVKKLDGFDNFFLGNAKKILEYEKIKVDVVKNGLTPMKPPIMWIFD